MKHEITNNFTLDAVKDNFTPPPMTEIRQDVVEHLFSRLGLSFSDFFQHIKKNSEYSRDGGKVFFWTTDVSNFIKQSHSQLLDKIEKGLPPLREEFPHNGNRLWERNSGFNSAINRVKALIQEEKAKL